MTNLSIKQRIARGVSALERDEYEVALADFQEILRERPGFPDIQNKAGLCMAMLGDSEGALEAFDHAVEANPTYAEAFLNRAITLNELGRYDEAQASFARAGEIDRGVSVDYPADLGNRIAIAHARLGDLYLEMNQPDRAVLEFRDALETRPNFVDVRSRLAHALMVNDEVEEGKEQLEETLRRSPFFLAARVRLGVAHLRLGDRDAALAEWIRCAEQDPKDRRVRAYLASIGHRQDGGRDGESEGAGKGHGSGDAENKSVLEDAGEAGLAKSAGEAGVAVNIEEGTTEAEGADLVSDRIDELSGGGGGKA